MGATLPRTTRADYLKRERVRHWTSNPDALREPRLLARRLRHWTRAQHKARADATWRKAARVRATWNRCFRAACLETFGREPEPGDYRIAAVGRDEFSEHWKRLLRSAGYGLSRVADVAAAHEYCALNWGRYHRQVEHSR